MIDKYPCWGSHFWHDTIDELYIIIYMTAELIETTDHHQLQTKIIV